MLGALPKADQRYVGPLSSRHGSDVVDADLARDDLMAESDHDRGHERKPIPTLVGDQDS